MFSQHIQDNFTVLTSEVSLPNFDTIKIDC